MPFEYKLYDFANVTELTEMYEQCFGVRVTDDYFKWKYLNNPSGKAIAFVARQNNKIAAFYGVIPEVYCIGEKKEVIYQSMDTMTHPHFQKMGLFTTLANMTYAYLRNLNGKLNVVGFPGASSYPGFIHKLGWSTLIELDYLFNDKLLFKINTLFVQKSGAKMERIDFFDEKFDGYFDQDVKSKKPISKYINRQIAQWRFFDSPTQENTVVKITENEEIKGFFVYRLDEKNRAFVVCLDVKEQQNLTLSMYAIFNHIFNNAKTNTVYTFQYSSPLIHRALKKIGFIRNPFSKGPFSYKTPLIVYGDSTRNEINFFDLRNWEIQPFLRDY